MDNFPSDKLDPFKILIQVFLCVQKLVLGNTVFNINAAPLSSLSAPRFYPLVFLCLPFYLSFFLGFLSSSFVLFLLRFLFFIPFLYMLYCTCSYLVFSLKLRCNSGFKTMTTLAFSFRFSQVGSVLFFHMLIALNFPSQLLNSQSVVVFHIRNCVLNFILKFLFEGCFRLPY